MPVLLLSGLLGELGDVARWGGGGDAEAEAESDADVNVSLACEII
jgi:hypothetical protein